jgi:V/A-type H+/Na+-transporting ATPase subunit K
MKTIRRHGMTGWVFMGLLALATLSALGARAAAEGAADDAVTVRGANLLVADTGASVVAAAKSEVVGSGTNAIYYAIALTMGLSCLAAGYAVGRVGAAALGVISEKPELIGRTLIFVGLAEGIAIYGLIIAIMLLQKIP